MFAQTLSHLLAKGRSTPLNRIRASASVDEAVQLMKAGSTGAVLVIDDRGFVGVFCERDLMTRVIAEGRPSRATRVRDVMSPAPPVLAPETTVEEAARLIADRRLRFVAVVAGGDALGLVTAAEIMNAVIRAPLAEPAGGYCRAISVAATASPSSA